MDSKSAARERFESARDGPIKLSHPSTPIRGWALRKSKPLPSSVSRWPTPASRWKRVFAISPRRSAHAPGQVLFTSASAPNRIACPA
jgi:hypothetical protein